MLSCVLVTFPYGVLGQVWYLIESIPDLCLLSYFVMAICPYILIILKLGYGAKLKSHKSFWIVHTTHAYARTFSLVTEESLYYNIMCQSLNM